MKSHEGIKVFDNGGESYDRYTVLIDMDVYSMSENPITCINGFNQYSFTYGEGVELPANFDRLGVLTPIQDLPASVIRAVFLRIIDTKET